MTAPRKIIQCPSCRFANRLGDARCLICKTELPTDDPGVAKGATRSAVAKPSPKGAAPKSALNPASNAAANARLAGKGAPSGAPGAPGAARVGEAKTFAVKRPVSFATEMRPALDPSELEDAPAPTAAAPPPKPLTRRIAKPAIDAVDAVAWIWCEPLPAIPLNPQRQVTVGRHETCDLVLPHKEVSRHHACFKVSGRQITLEDQGSSNGCYVNGKRCASQIVKIGDRIQIGPYEIDIRATGTESSEASASDTKFDLTSMSNAGPNASMTGKLAEVSLVEILQGIEFNSKTCTLAISDGKLRGEVIFAQGRPMHATFGAERDLDAVRAMLRLKDGRFVLSNQVEGCDPTMNTTITALLLDASRVMDEGSKAPEPAPTVATADAEAGDATEAVETAPAADVPPSPPEEPQATSAPPAADEAASVADEAPAPADEVAAEAPPSDEAAPGDEAAPAEEAPAPADEPVAETAEATSAESASEPVAAESAPENGSEPLPGEGEASAEGSSGEPEPAAETAGEPAAETADEPASEATAPVEDQPS